MATPPPSEKPFKDEELNLESGRVLSHADNPTLPTHVQHSDLENIERELGGRLTHAWRRFNGYGRKHVGFFGSVKAVVLSSCGFISTAFSCICYLLRIP